MSKKITHDIYEEWFSPQKIQDYLTGRLPSHEMHQMEVLMQENPFLADTMEGLAMLPQQEQVTTALADLQGKMPYRQGNTKKIGTTHRKYWMRLSVAASVLIVLGVATLLVWRTIDQGMHKEMAEATQSVAYLPDTTVAQTQDLAIPQAAPMNNDMQSSAVIATPKTVEVKHKEKAEGVPQPAHAEKPMVSSNVREEVAADFATIKAEGEEAAERKAQSRQKEVAPLRFSADTTPPITTASTATTTPVPIGGWDMYYEQLEKKLVRKEGMPKGNVVIEAEVNAQGEVIATKVLLPLTEICNEAAQAAVRATGKWQVRSYNTSQKVKVTVKF